MHPLTLRQISNTTYYMIPSAALQCIEVSEDRAMELFPGKGRTSLWFGRILLKMSPFGETHFADQVIAVGYVPTTMTIHTSHSLDTECCISSKAGADRFVFEQSREGHE